MKNSGPLTTNGVHMSSQNRVIEKGHKGGEAHVAVKAGNGAHLHEKKTQGVRHNKPQASKPALAPKQGAETKTVGSTAEEQKKLAGKFYPTVLGLRGASIA